MLRNQRLNEIAKKEKTIDNNLFKEQFDNSSPSNVQKFKHHKRHRRKQN